MPPMSRPLAGVKAGKLVHELDMRNETGEHDDIYGFRGHHLIGDV
jgi:hypothetical protein